MRNGANGMKILATAMGSELEGHNLLEAIWFICNQSALCRERIIMDWLPDFRLEIEKNGNSCHGNVYLCRVCLSRGNNTASLMPVKDSCEFVQSFAVSAKRPHSIESVMNAQVLYSRSLASASQYLTISMQKREFSVKTMASQIEHKSMSQVVLYPF